jgi:putative endonuclease
LNTYAVLCKQLLFTFKNKMAYMYILECVGNRLYVGSTLDLEKRFFEHQTGLGSNFTTQYRPIRIAYFEEFPNVSDAFRREQQIKNWSRQKKMALISRERSSLIVLARKGFP